MRDKRETLWRDNSGFSLIELLIVLAISAILLTIVTIAYAVVHNADVSRAARNFDSVLARARTESMAKGTDAGQLNLYMENGVLYYWLGDPANMDYKEEICNSMIDVRLFVKDYMGYSLDFGAFPEGTVYSVRFATTGFVQTPKASGEFYVYSLWFTRGDRTVSTSLYTTGKTDTRLR